MHRMTVRVAVADPLPMYARGLAVTLRGLGHAADVPSDLLGWARSADEVVVFLTVLGDADWALLAALLKIRADAVVVVVVTHPDVRHVIRAISSGAVGVMARNAGPTVIADVVRAALGGHSRIAIGVLRSLVAGMTGDQTRQPISDEEIRWLRELAGGTTVARLAEKVGYSERMMFRLLAELYARLGVESRTKALMRARDEGWL
jgi:DNA-binding NarL/FixJ family response regulator